MGLIHKHLYQHEEFSHIDLHNYVKELIDSLKSTFAKKSGNLTLDLNVDRLNIDLDTSIPLGLIINELVTNSFKHAFDQTAHPKLSISLKKADDSIELKVRDNGKAIVEGLENSQSFGWQLVNSLAQKLDGHVEFTYGRRA